MPKSGLPVRRIAVTARHDGRMFAGNVEVTIGDPPKGVRLRRRAGPWPLSEATAVDLGLASRITQTSRWGQPYTFTVRFDRAVRLHRCKMCRGFFIAHYSAGLCSDACAKANHQAWVDAHRRPVAPSKAGQRRAALAAARCQVCGAPFKPLRLSARFCSNRCRQKQHRDARKAA